MEDEKSHSPAGINASVRQFGCCCRRSVFVGGKRFKVDQTAYALAFLVYFRPSVIFLRGAFQQGERFEFVDRLNSSPYLQMRRNWSSVSQSSLFLFTYCGGRSMYFFPWLSKSIVFWISLFYQANWKDPLVFRNLVLRGRSIVCVKSKTIHVLMPCLTPVCIAAAEMVFWLIVEYHPQGSLIDYLKSKSIDAHTFSTMAYSLASGLSYLHAEITVDRKF